MKIKVVITNILFLIISILFLNTDIDGVVVASAFHFNYYKELLNKKEILLQGSTNFLVNKDYKNIFFFGINDLKKYLKSKNINIR